MVREEGVLLIGFSITIVPEDTTLFDRMTAFHLQNGIPKNGAVSVNFMLLLTKLPGDYGVNYFIAPHRTDNQYCPFYLSNQGIII